MSILGDNLKARRLELDMSQAEIAAIINKAPETYCRYEAGTLKPDVDTLVILANLYETSMDALTGRDLKYMAKIMFQMGYKAGDEAGKEILRKRASRKKKEAQ